MTNLIRLTFSVLFLVFSSAAGAQTAVKDSSGVFVAVHKTRATAGQDSLLRKKFKDSKGNYFPVYVSKRGKYYILRKSGKTGNLYKQYLTL